MVCSNCTLLFISPSLLTNSMLLSFLMFNCHFLSCLECNFMVTAVRSLSLLPPKAVCSLAEFIPTLSMCKALFVLPGCETAWGAELLGSKADDSRKKIRLWSMLWHIACSSLLPKKKGLVPANSDSWGSFWLVLICVSWFNSLTQRRK